MASQFGENEKVSHGDDGVSLDSAHSWIYETEIRKAYAPSSRQ